MASHRTVKGYGILKMLHLLQSEASYEISEDLLHKARILDRYYIEARYPNGFPTGKPADYFDQKLAEEAIHAAETLLEFCRDHVH